VRKSYLYLVFLFVLLLTPSSTYIIEPYKICFTPPEHCGDLVVNEITKAKTSIFVQAYGFTSKKIITALIEAKKRGVEIKIILDRSNFHKRNNNILSTLQEAKITVYEDKIKGIAHNKIMILDNHKVITGSFNFTENADKRNAENIFIIDNSKVAAAYHKNWLFRAHTEKIIKISNKRLDK
jgi:phospholipase D